MRNRAHQFAATIQLVLFFSLLLNPVDCRSVSPRSARLMTPPAPPAAIDVRNWHQALVTTRHPVNELPFFIAETRTFDVFTFAEASFFAQEPWRPPLGRPPAPERLSIEQRARLREFLFGIPGRQPHFGSTDLFINGPPDVEEGRDISGNAGRTQAIRKSAGAWANNEFQLSKEYDRLVTFRWLPAGVPGALPQPDAPATMIAYVRAEFQRLRAELAPAIRARLDGWTVEIAAPPELSTAGESLWMKVSPGRKVLWLSPQLLRTFFLQAIQEELIREYPQLLQNTNLTPRGLDRPELTAQVASRFEGAVKGSLAHLMAHVYLDVTGVAAADRESRYDQAASQAIGSASALRQATFRNVLNRAIVAGSGSEWGVEEANDGEAVRTRISGS